MVNRAERSPSPGPGRRRRLWLGLALAAPLVLTAALAVLLRAPIGAQLLIGYFRTRGLPAVVRFDHVGLGGVAGSLRLGPPSDPDLSVERMEIDFAPGLDWRGMIPQPRIAAVRLIRPRLKLTWDGRRIGFGALEPLAKDLLARRAGVGAGPRVEATDALVRVATPAGTLKLTGGAEAANGRIVRLRGWLAPVRLSGRGASAEISGGWIAVSGGASMRGRISVRVRRLTWREVTAEDLTGGIGFNGADPTRPGPLAAALELRARSITRAEVELDHPAASLVFDGRRAPDDSLAGQARLRLLAKGARRGPGRIESLALDLASPRVTGGRAGIAAPAAGRLSIGRVLLPVGSDRLALSAIRWSGRADVTGGAGGFTARLDGRLGAATAMDSTRLARQSSGDGQSLAGLLRHGSLSATDLNLEIGPRRLALAAPRAIRLQAASGAALILSPAGPAPLLRATPGRATGAFSVLMRGPGAPQVQFAMSRYRLERRSGGWSGAGDAALSLSIDTPRLRDVHAKTAGRIRLHPGGGWSFEPAGCVEVRAAEVLATDKPVLTDASGELCPAKAQPLIAPARGGWRLRGVAREVRAEAPGLQAEIRGGSGALELANGLHGRVGELRATVADLRSKPLYRPVLIAGALASSGADWRGELQISDAAGRRALGRVLVRQDPASGTGEARIEAPQLVFSPDGLQPADVFPVAADLATDVQGPVSFSGEVRWRRGELTSSGQLRAEGLSLRTMLGQVRGLRTVLALNSLAPVTSPVGQIATAESVESITSLSEAQARFALTSSAVEVEAGQAEAFGGKVTMGAMRLPFAAPHLAQADLRFSSIDMAALVAAAGLADRVSAQARLDGQLRFAVSADGPKILGGSLASTGPGRLSIHPSALTGASASGGAPGASPDAMRELAFKALQDLAFDRLDAVIEPRPQGRLGAVFTIAGRHDPKIAPDVRVSVLDILRGKAFKRSIPLPKGTPINLTLDTSINFDELMRDYLAAQSSRRSAGVQP